MYLDPDINLQLHQKVKDGLYPSKEDALIVAMKLLDQKDAFARFVNKAIEEGEEDVKNGNMLTLEQVKEKMKKVKEQFFASKKNERN